MGAVSSWFGAATDDQLREIRSGPSTFKEKEDYFRANNRELPSPFVKNGIRTAKYTWYDFLPRSFCGQFQRLGNIYFLIQTFIMVIGEFSTLYPSPLESWSMIMVLLFVVGLSMCFEARDDYYRWKKDRETNQTSGNRIQFLPSESKSPTEELISWADFCVGDLVFVRNGEAFPSDLVLLTSSELDGNAYVETANIDGETNLKLRSAPKKISDRIQASDKSDAAAAMRNACNTEISCKAAAPNAGIDSFMATLKCGGEEFPCSLPQFLHRGSVLRNTTWAIGMVVYTGAQTKIILNSADPPVKRSTIDKTVDKILYIVIFAQCCLVTVADIGFLIWSSQNIEKKEDLGYYSTWYLIPPGDDEGGYVFPNGLAYWLSYFILFNNFVPINIYVTMDLCNLLQGVFINNDITIYCEETDTAASCRASNLCQELGMIEYIFSDKTGTLTQNVMKLKKVAVGESSFGNTEAKDFDTNLLCKMLNKGTDKQIEDFFVVLAVSHTVVTDKEGAYQAESPDEAALVDGAAEVGYRFNTRRGEQVEVTVAWENKPRTYQIEAINSFNSKRKRMSVVAKMPDGSYELLIKGADNVIFDRCDEKTTDQKMLNNHLNSYSTEGLRTLLVGRRKLSNEEFKAWKQKYDNAATTVGDNRKQLLEECAEEIEKNIEVLGVTAIEDKLQEDVAKTISNLAEAGIKLWVLTGDKVETAINIGYSCKVLVPDMKVIKITETQPDKINLRLERLVQQLRDLSDDDNGADAKVGMQQSLVEINKISLKNMGLVITGPTLTHIMEHEIRRNMLLELGMACKVVIACRVSPLQKSLLVEMVRQGIKPEPITLAIGDGANDVTMIQRAHVGVGISGNEGQQAANVSDFSISRFKYLQRLLLVHGRWNYRRICKVITYVFYKNFCLTLTLLYFSFTTGFSGTSLYDSWVYTSFNIHTMLPICAVGCLDQDVRSETVEMFPALYMTGRLNLDLNSRIIIQYILLAIVHSLIVVFWPYFSYFGLDQTDLGGLYVFGTLVFSCLVFTVQYRVMLITVTWTSITAIVLAISFLGYFLFLVIYGVWYDLSWNFYWVPYQMMGSAIFWVVLFGVPATALYFDFVLHWVSREFFPTVMDFAVEADYMMNKDEVMKNLGKQVKQQLRDQGGVAKEVHEELNDIEMHELEKASAEEKKQGTTKGFDFSHPGATPAPLHRAMTTRKLTEEEKKSLERKDQENNASSSKSQNAGRVNADRKDTHINVSMKGHAFEDTKLHSNRPADESTWCGRFLQQRLPRAQKPLTPRVTMIVLSIVGCFFILIGGLVIMGSNEASYQMVMYEGDRSDYESLGYELDYQDCKLAAARNQTERVCDITMDLKNDMKAPVFVRYGLTNFYQNYQSYAKDHYSYQLDGSTKDTSTQYCKYFNSEDGETYVPCGLQAHSMFNDTFELISPTSITMSEDDISWHVDRNKRFGNPSGYPEFCNSTEYECLYEMYPGVIPEEEGQKNEHFMVWMRTAALGVFMKKYARIDQDLNKGDSIVFRVTARFVTSPFEGGKAIILTKDSWIGGRNTFMGVAMVSMGCVVLLTVAIMCVKECVSPRKLGNVEILEVKAIEAKEVEVQDASKRDKNSFVKIKKKRVSDVPMAWQEPFLEQPQQQA
mmetsp:Transcript_2276/g.3364  ORF Transcript_2276/g.3364 Transcript_2276/m.3364 type:complete len:1627 (-) Transcript_2276:287-5167(-)